MRFSDKLRDLMKQQGLTQRNLCQLTGIAASSVSQYLSGEHEPYNERKKEIARALGVEENYFEVFLPEPKIQTDPSANLPVAIAAKLMGKSISFVAQGLRDGVFPFGYAVKLDKWSYFISSVKFTECTGIAVPLNGSQLVGESV